MQIYVVQKGDTLYGIARKTNVSVADLMNYNQLDPNLPIMVGQALIIDTEKASITVNGYAYPTISMDALLAMAPALSYLSIFSYQALPNGFVKLIRDYVPIQRARQNGVAPVFVLTNIGESGRFESELAHQILTQPEIQTVLMENCLSIMLEKNYTAINIDFEYIYPADLTLYNQMIERFTEFFHKAGFPIFTSLAPKRSKDQMGTLYEAHDYAFHGKTVDQVILMTYEWGYTYGPPMAVAPLPQVERILQYAVTEIPSEKIWMGIPNYGYDWTLPFDRQRPAKSLSNVAAVRLAQEKRVEIQYDPMSQAPYFYYRDEQGQLHVVWFEDARSIEAKMELVKKYQLGGISYWTVMTYFAPNRIIPMENFHIEKHITTS